ncbi:D-alanyl-D-alanine carboxypeptidase family protein [Amorphus orientalis]|uniref:D-alanyl-D-alanine carboxypeptidase n=1 Tax=Amorphus orientalis TaxID=649198 RepID=A0AAE3VQW4_9HYPH|nr:D-alanyl-D-alanine carboxypeptidase family protein [Amorphus orientalis]MDQ0316516.1 D-alanyl-D-alanine carboxypeptidase [Amorphus orientalis]
MNRVAVFRRMRDAAQKILLAGLVVATVAGTARAEIGSYIVFDLNTGVILDEHNPTKPWYPASLTKLMTAYVVFRALDEGRITLKSPVVMSENARREPPSKMGFPVGSVITIDTALKIILVKSANDVSVALGEAVSGSESEFLRAMNRESRRLGMTQSNWTNPHGLPDKNHVSSARDMAMLVQQIRKEFPEYDHLFKITGFKLGPKTYKNHNYLVGHFPGTTGMKTGFICSSGFNLAATAKRGGRELGAIVLGGYTSRERNEETAKLLEIGFRARTGLFSGKRRTIDDLRHLSVTAGRPVDLRPIVCGSSRPKTAYSDRSNVVPFDEVDEQQMANAYAANGRDAFNTLFTGGRDEVTLSETGTQVISYLRKSVPVDPPIVLSMGGAEGPPVGVDPETGEPASVAAGMIPVPRPRPLLALVTDTNRIDPAEVVALADSVRRSAKAAADPGASQSIAGEIVSGETVSGEDGAIALAEDGAAMTGANETDPAASTSIPWFPKPKPGE